MPTWSSGDNGNWDPEHLGCISISAADVGEASSFVQHLYAKLYRIECLCFQIQGMPFGNYLPVSDGPINNSTGIPFFYVTPKDNSVADLMKNPVASLTLPEADGDFCRY